MTHTFTIDESDRQLLLLAMAKLCIERPGWDYYMQSIAAKLGGKQSRELYEQFKEIHSIDPA